MTASPESGAKASGGIGPLGMITIVATALVGFNTLVTSCAADRAARDAAQLHKIEQRERFWTEALRELSDILAAKEENPAGGGWKSRCLLLASRTAPFVVGKEPEGTRDPDGEIRTTQELLQLDKRAYKLEDRFRDQLEDERVVTNECSTRFTVALIAENIRRKELRQAGKSDEEAAVIEPAQMVGSITAREEQIALTGQSPTGWDIDVFWCERSVDQASDRNFRRALWLGEQLAARERLAGTNEDYQIGRIRVRMLSEALLRSPAYRFYASGRKVVSDADNEVGLVSAVRQLDPLLVDSPRPDNTTAPATPYYISVFYCAAGSPPPGSEDTSTSTPGDAAPAAAN